MRVRINQVAVMAFQWVTADFRTMSHLYNNSVVANVPWKRNTAQKEDPRTYAPGASGYACQLGIRERGAWSRRACAICAEPLRLLQRSAIAGFAPGSQHADPL